jgi:cell division protein ZapB
MDSAMVAEIAALEEKVRQTAQLCQILREENRGLRLRIATLESDRKQLEERIESARLRLENLLKQVPE